MNFQKKIYLISYLLLFIYLILGIFIYDDYGISWDEHFHRISGFVSLNFFRDLFGFDIYPGLEHKTEFFKEDTKLYGILFDLPMAYLEKKFSLNDSQEFYYLRHFSNFFIFYISSIFFYLILIRRFNVLLSLIGLLFLILSPRIFADSFYNLKDSVFLSFFIISLYFSIRFIDHPSYKNALLSALTCSLSVGIKILGIISPFIVIVFFFLQFIDSKIFLKKNISILAFFILLFISFTILFWPYLWSDPLSNFIKAIIHFSSQPWPGTVFYLGNYISAQNLPWHYPIVWILISTPIIYLVFFLIGSFFVLKRLVKRFLNLSLDKTYNDLWRGKKERMDVIFFLIFYFTLFLIIILNSTLYGGWRHLYFIYPCLIFISIKGIEYILMLFKTKYLLFLLIPFLLSNSFWMYKNHPYQFLFFNKLATNKPQNLFELDYWGLSNITVLNYIIENNENYTSNIYVFSKSPYALSTYLLDKDKRERVKFVKNVSDADFLVTNHYYQKGNPIDIDNNLKNKYKLLKEFTLDGMTFNSIYKIK